MFFTFYSSLALTALIALESNAMSLTSIDNDESSLAQL